MARDWGDVLADGRLGCFRHHYLIGLLVEELVEALIFVRMFEPVVHYLGRKDWAAGSLKRFLRLGRIVLEHIILVRLGFLV